jgi:hypothetical protein
MLRPYRSDEEGRKLRFYGQLRFPEGITLSIEVSVEREKRCIRTCSFHAEDAIDNIQVPLCGKAG